ncbi:YceI family protein [Mycetocola spongiae]|uniref:YceI family protein n=1 Tax=Mycetocola spongiae TaxID=2859226 RepID=UPI001CF2D51C|nr:YceI family protein [Mycetocola spongiae]UCR89485.1 YceI family protein [Mycetocola spongiae]
MQKKTGIILGASAAALIILGATLGPVIYRDVFAAPAADAPTTALENAAAPELGADELAGEWTVGSGSTAGYRVDEVLNGTDVTVTGRTEQVSGSVTASATGIEAAVISVDTASIATDNGTRDNYFRGTVARSAQFPQATFTLTAPIAFPADPTAAGPHTATATGTLSFAGVERSVSAEISAVIDGTTVRLAGSVPLVFADYGVSAPDLGFVKVEDHGSVEFILNLERA